MKQKRTRKAAPTRTLKANWTVDLSEDLKSQHSLDLEDELAKILCQEIDNEVIQNIHETVEKDELMKKGWVRAPFTTEKFAHDSLSTIEDVAAWIHINATGEYRIFGREFWFQRQKDLTAFILRWS